MMCFCRYCGLIFQSYGVGNRELACPECRVIEGVIILRGGQRIVIQKTTHDGPPSLAVFPEVGAMCLEPIDF